MWNFDSLNTIEYKKTNGYFMMISNMLLVMLGPMYLYGCAANWVEGKSEAEKNSSSALFTMYIIHLSVVATACLGCVSVFNENLKILYAHGVFLTFLLFVNLMAVYELLEVSAGIPSQLRLELLGNSTVDGAGHNLAEYWDNLQSKYECCGSDGPGDYFTLHRDIPISCCACASRISEEDARRDFHSTCLRHQLFFTKGCQDVLRRKSNCTHNILVLTGMFFWIILTGKIIIVIVTVLALKDEEHQKVPQTAEPNYYDEKIPIMDRE